MPLDAAGLRRVPVRVHSCEIRNLFRSLTLFRRCAAAFPLFVVDVHKHLCHTQKFNSGIAQTDIALGFVGA
jgi:hypothetical protein